ncbi:MAG: hypothetical protein NT166_02250 [Candidatus Aminicenantes bacterium]|jgi:hypothetical protein|nr:hypothetical protein [Candidatus Aminicenantes bacterium]
MSTIKDKFKKIHDDKITIEWNNGKSKLSKKGQKKFIDLSSAKKITVTKISDNWPTAIEAAANIMDAAKFEILSEVRCTVEDAGEKNGIHKWSIVPNTGVTDFCLEIKAKKVKKPLGSDKSDVFEGDPGVTVTIGEP